ncbi:MAG: DUF1772 domain-containing protein [Bdellovibrionales bacterium]
MNTEIIQYMYLALGFTSAMVGGVFLSFSDFVMRGFAQSDNVSAIDCMQSLNRTVFRSIFLTNLLGLAPITIAASIYVNDSFTYSATGTYLLSVILVTIRGNVPMNEKLDKMDKNSDEAKAYWKIYLKGWTRWNHIRTIGSFITSALFLIAVL